MVHARPNLELGDVIILEAGEKLCVSRTEREGTAKGAEGLCLVSALHVVSFVGEGNGGWKDNIITVGKEGQPGV